VSRFRRLRLRLRHGGKSLKSRNGKLYVDDVPHANLDAVAAVHDKPFPKRERNRSAPSWARYASGSLADRLREALGWRERRERLHKRANRRSG